jgi:hypothetical protein
MKTIKKCLTKGCDEPVNQGQYFCSTHVIVAKKETSDQKNRRIAPEKQMAESLAAAKKNEQKFIKKQKDGMEAAAKEQAKAREIAGLINKEAIRIANLVKGYRVNQPTTNAGSNGTLGGTDNPLSFSNLDWGKLESFHITPYISWFDDSISGTSKTRIKHPNHQDVLIHLSL